MNKKVTSLLLVFVMVFSMVATAVPARAAGSNEFVIVPNKTEVTPGDTVTYSVVIGPIENFQSANFTLIIPEGLTFVSGAVAEGLKELTGATEAGFENSTLTFYHGGLEAYTCDHNTVLMTFTCAVNADASGEYEIQIMDDYDFADNGWTSYDMHINTAASRITVAEKSAPAFAITPNKTEVAPGDTVTYSVVIGPIENFQSANFTLIIPEGLTFVSGAVAEGLKELTGATEAGFENSTLTFYHGGLEAYTCDHDTVLMTFTCTVNADASGEYEIQIMDDYDFADNAWTSYDMIINTAASKITVAEKSTPATGIVLNKETLSLKVGESETLVATLTPADATDVVVWISSDNAIAAVDANGKVTAVAEGTATITAQAGDVSATCVVTTECAHTNTTEHPAKESTCTEQGNGAYTTCDDCGDVIEGSAEKLPLDPDNHVDITTFPADTGTCINPGHAEYSFCNDCESIISGSDSPVAGPHGNYVEKAEEKYLKTVADCDSAAVYYKSCELCGEAHATETFTYGSALGHSFTNYVSNNDATCTEDGTKTAKCDRCDVTDTITDVGSAKGHDYADATCTAPKTCKVCGVTEGDPLGHSYATTWSKGEDGHWHECSACGDETDFAAHDYGDGDKCVVCEYERAHIHRLTLVPAVDATCTTDGNVAYYTCSGCENWFEDASGSVVISDKTSVVIAALGHDLTDATCTEAPHCKREGCEYTEGSALGHSFTNYVSNNDATCTEDGTKTAKCDRCDVTDTITDVGSAKGHDYADATCTTPKTCKVCGATEGDSLGHSFTNYVSNNDATCTEDGTKTAKCDRCDVTDTITDVGSAKGHDYAEATCTAPKTCKVCGMTEGDPLGHSYATTWSKGEDSHWHECERCHDKTDVEEHYDETEDDKCDACGYELDHVHHLTLVPAVDATCTTDGNVAYYTCSGCENWFEDASGSVVISDKTSVVIAALGHDLTDTTCTEAPHCKREGCEYTEGSALGHSFTNYVSNNDATCTEDGTKTAKCDRCDVTDTITDVGSTLGHDFGDWYVIVEAKCGVAGEERRDCSRCTHFETRATDALVHNYVDEVTDPDCTKDGFTTHTCAYCGHKYTDNVIPALGHSYAITWSKGEDGHWHECSVCGDETDFGAHNYGDGDKCAVCEYERAHIHHLTLVVAVDATCTTDGSKAYYTCSGCENWFEDASGSIVIEDKTTVIIAALGHDLTEATCTEAAYCKREGCDYVEGSALGHDFEAAWTYDEEKHWHNCSRCEAKGNEEAHIPGAEATEESAQTCTICGYEIAPALEHTHELTKVEATVTCTEAGHIAYYTCACGKWFADAEGTIEITDKDSVKSDALGHTDADGNGKCDACDAEVENEQPTVPDKPTDDVPQTGDNSNPILWTMLLAMSFVGLITCVFYIRKRNLG